MANNLEFIDSVNSTSTITNVNFDNIFISDKSVGAYKIKIKIYMITHTDLFFLSKKF